MRCRSAYNPEERTGSVVYNLSLVRSEDLEFAIKIFKDSFRAGISVSGLVRFLQPGAKLDEYTVPEGCTGIVSVCSSTLDGLLLRRGIPMKPIGGGIVEIDHMVPRRFIHMILYEHTTIDPLQVLISQELTSVNAVMRRGSGNLLANIRECHMEAEPVVGKSWTVLQEAIFQVSSKSECRTPRHWAWRLTPSIWGSWRWEEQIPWRR